MSRVGVLLLIVARSLRQHALSTLVTVLSTALASGLVMSVFVVNEQSQAAFESGDAGFDAVLGARGSALQLVLNTVFHLETSPGNIPWSMYEDVKSRPGTALALPYAVGDNFKGYRIVGTTEEIFTDFEYREGKPFEFLGNGRGFDPSRQEAVVGYRVAVETGLRAGDTFQPYHGPIYDEKKKHAATYLVTGITAPTNTPSDNVIWIPIEGFYRMEGHELRGNGERYLPEDGVEIADEHKELSAVMLKFRSPRVGQRLHQEVNLQGKVATLAWPIGTVMGDIFRKLGWMARILQAVAYLVVVVAAGSILASIYNTMNERRREFAILRALGARRSTVFSVIVLESGTIAALGGLAGFAVYTAIFTVARGVIQEKAGVLLDFAVYHPVLILTPLGMTVLGALSGLLPAYKAYSTDVAETLVHGS